MKRIVVLCFIVFFQLSLIIYPQSNRWSGVMTYYDPPDPPNQYKFRVNCNLVMGIQCLDSNDCIAVLNCNSRYMRVLRTTDQGLSWKQIFFDTVNAFSPAYAVSYPAKGYVYIGGYWGLLLKTNDDFKTTNKVVFNNVSDVTDLYMADTLVGLAGTTPTKLFITTDGWKTYRQIKKNPKWYFYWPAYIFDSLNFILAYTVRDTNNTNIEIGIARTSDGGQSWHEFKLDKVNNNFDGPIGAPGGWMYFKNRMEGFFAGGRNAGIGNTQFDLLFKTTDGGFTWEKILDRYDSPAFGLGQICFRDSLFGIVVGPWGKLYKTEDGGRTWERVYFNEPMKTKIDNAPVVTCAIPGEKIIIGTFGCGIWQVTPSEVDFVEKNYKTCNFINNYFVKENLEFNLNWILENEPLAIVIYDILGRIVEKKLLIDLGTEKLVIPVTHWSEGYYYFKVMTKNEVFYGSFVKY